MIESVALCLRHGVAIGAHPSYPDREGFGRRDMALAPDEVHAAVLYQVGALSGIAAAAGTRLAHVKPHGALYNRAAVDRSVADAIARAVHGLDPSLALVGLAGSCLPEAGRALGLRVLAEGFADRRYTASGELVSRRDARALIDDPAEAEAQALGMIRDGRVRAVDGAQIPLRIDMLCLHGDAPQAVAFAQRLRAALGAADIAIRAPAA
jgi:UPF0271 protein